MRRSLFFILDYSRDSGMGHYMRCRSLMKTLGEFKRFDVTAAVIGDLQEKKGILRQDRIQGITVDNSPKAARILMDHIKRHRPDTVIIDSYFLGRDFYLRLKKAMPTTQVIAFDDFLEKAGFPVNGVINTGLGSLVLKYPHSLEENGAIGTRYLSFREEFLTITSRRHRRNDGYRLLVTFGGADPERQTERVLSIVKKIPALDRIDVVVGPSFGKRSAIDRLAGMDSRVCLHKSPENIAELMRATDLVVCGAGITASEALFLRKPVAVLVLAENQACNAAAIAKFRFGLNLGRYDRVTDADIRKGIVSLLNRARRKQSSANLRKLFSRDGSRLLAERIAVIIDKYHGDRFPARLVRKEYDCSSLKRQEFQKARWGSEEGMENRFSLAWQVLGRPQRIASWLDVGCGTGAFLRNAETSVKVGSFTGIDLSGGMLRFARSQSYLTKRTQFIRQDFLDDLPARSFSLVTSIGVLQKCGVSLQKAVARFAELTAPSGRVFTTTKNADWLEFTSGRLKPFRGHHWFSLEEIRHAFHAAGLSIIAMKGFEPRILGKTCPPEKSHSVFVLAEKA